jgi:cytochrome P460
MGRFLFAIAAIFLFVAVLGLDAQQQLAQQGAQERDIQPVYVGGKLVRPANYREWVFLSSGLGMNYNAAAGGPELFTNVFVPQWAYREFLASGKWPQRTMFVLEERVSENKGSINKSGHFQSDLKGLAVEVKDESRFADRWAYFSFGGDA